MDAIISDGGRIRSVGGRRRHRSIDLPATSERWRCAFVETPMMAPVLVVEDDPRAELIGWSWCGGHEVSSPARTPRSPH